MIKINKSIIPALIICIGMLLNQSLFAQFKLLEKVEKKSNELVIPYEKYRLPNGLTVLIHVDNSDPVVHVDVTYHVGSAREELGRSGFAHFFEHMMFQGSDNVADEEHFRIVTESGGTLNGTTNLDRTNYFETVPSNQLETALWLEADRMGFLLDAVTQEKFEIQRATVKNERGQNYDNRPYGLVGEKTVQALYPFGHPYSWPTIGYLSDLDRVTVDDLKRFFLRWYGPNNAVLTVAGDINPQDVLKLAQKYFGSIPVGPEVKAQAKVPVALDKNRYISYEDNVKFPMIQLTWPTVPSGHPDEYALDLLADILAGSKSSILYQSLIKTNIALQARAYNPAFELAGYFSINSLPNPGTSLAELEKLIRDGLDAFEKRGVNNEDLERFKNSREADLIRGLQSVSGKASKLAYYETFRNNPNWIKEELKLIQNLKTDDITRVYNTYIKGKPAVILSVVAKGNKDKVAAPDNFSPKLTSEMQGEEGQEYKNLKYNKAKDSFDRSIKPSPGLNPEIKLPAYFKSSLANGLKIISTEDKDLPMVSVILSIPAGHAFESNDQAGISSLLAAMLEESTTELSAEVFDAELEKLGSSISWSSDRESIYANIFSLKKNLKRTLELFELSLLKPKFDTSEFNTAKSQRLSAIENKSTRAAALADDVYYKLLYGNHVLGTPVIGTKESIEKLSADDIRSWYNKVFNPSNSNLIIVGDISQNEIKTSFDFLNKWQGKPSIEAQKPTISNIEKTQIYFVDKPNAPQSEIRIGYLSLPFDATGEYYRAGLMNFPLGGAFNSRINLNLREKRGFTYGARSSFNGSKYVGPFTANAGVKAEKTDSSIIEFMNELSLYKERGITDQELAFTKSSLGQQEALKYETPFQKATFLNRILYYNLEDNFLDQQREILKNITKSDIDALAKRYLKTDNMFILVVGDKNTHMAAIKNLGYPVVELDVDGNIVQ